MEIFKLFGSVLVETSGAEQALDKTGKKSESLSAKFVNAFKKIGAAVLTYFSTKAIIDFGNECISLASDVEEMENKFNVVFQGMTDEVNVWADSYAKAIGRNTNTIKGFLADNQNMFVGMGMTRDAGADLSKRMIELAFDLASFNNLNEADAVNAMSKALMGESESAKSLGAVLNENTLALAMEELGYKGKFTALSEAVKMEVRYQAILMQSKDAIGDCERSLDSFKGRQIQLASTTENLKEKIGGYLLPVMTSLLEKANQIANFFFDNVDPAIEKVSSGFQTLRSDAELMIATLLEDFPALAEAMYLVETSANDFFESISFNADTIPKTYKILREGVVKAYSVFTEMLDKAASIISDANIWIREHKTGLELAAIAIGTFTVAILANNAAHAVMDAGGISRIAWMAAMRLQFALSTISIEAHTVATWLANTATTAWGVALAFLTSPITLVVAAIGALIAIIVLCVKHWDTISATVQRVAADVVAWIGAVPGNIAQKATEMYQTAAAWLQQFATGIYEGFLELVGKIGDWVEENIIAPIINKATAAENAGKQIIADLLSGLKSAWKSVSNWFDSAWDSLFNKNVSVSANSSGSVSVSGYATGLNYVPYDNFPAFLHKGEAVLTAAQAKAWRSRNQDQRPANHFTINQYIQTVPQTPVEIAAATEAYFEMARWS